MAKASTSGASRVRKRSRRTSRTASRTFTLRSTTPSSPSPTVRAMPCRGRRRVAQASRARASRRRSPRRLPLKRLVALPWNMASRPSKCASRAPARRESSVRALNALGIKISSIADITPVPHNGCRPPKRRVVSKGNPHGTLYWTQMQALAPRGYRPVPEERTPLAGFKVQAGFQAGPAWPHLGVPVLRTTVCSCARS